jgi:hypothetical protein
LEEPEVESKLFGSWDCVEVWVSVGVGVEVVMAEGEAVGVEGTAEMSVGETEAVLEAETETETETEEVLVQSLFPPLQDHGNYACVGTDEVIPVPGNPIRRCVGVAVKTGPRLFPSGNL